MMDSKCDYYEVVDTDYRKSVIEDAINYCSSDEFIDSIDNFRERKSTLFSTSDAKLTECEHSLEYTVAFKEYQTLVDGLLENFVKSRKSTITEFYAECRDSMEGKFTALFEEHEHKWFVEMLLSWMDYDYFYTMMIETSRSKSNRSKK